MIKSYFDSFVKNKGIPQYTISYGDTVDSLNNVIPVISHTYDEIESSMVRSSGVGLTDKFITRTFNEVTAKVFRINFSWDDNGDDTPQVQALIFGFTEPPDHYKIERSLDLTT